VVCIVNCVFFSCIFIADHNSVENRLQPSGINVTSDLPPKPYPRQRKSPQSNKCQQDRLDKIRLIQGERNDADELSVKFEQILEGILDLECVVMDGKENKSCNSLYHDEPSEDEVVEPDSSSEEKDATVNTLVVGTHHLNSNTTSTSQVIPVEVSIFPVVGKPPKPPSSANRHLGKSSLDMVA